MSADGKVLLQQQANFTAGNNLVNLDISRVPCGFYLVQVELKDGMVVKKFIRQQ